MRKLTYLAAFALAATAAFTACKKDEKDESVTGAARKTTLVANKWNLTALAINNINQLDSLDACQRDNYYTFTNDGKYFELENTNKCVAGKDTADNGTYSFNADYTQLTQDGFPAEITSFKSNSFSAKVTLGPIVQTATFTKK